MTASNEKPQVYFAGKISENDWRHRIVPELRYAVYEEGPYDAGAYIYNGPFFIGCDHGCNHGPTTHGALPRQDWHIDSCYEPNGYPLPDRFEVARRAVEGVRRSQLVFAYINALDCIGTTMEIGIAVQMRKPVALCVDACVDEREFWLPEYCPGVTMISGITEGDLSSVLRKELGALQNRDGRCTKENRIVEAIEVLLSEGVL